MKNNNLKKKAALTLAVLGLGVSPVVDSGLSLVGLSSQMNRAEAATALTAAEATAKGYPTMSGVTYYDNGTVEYTNRVTQYGSTYTYKYRGTLVSYDNNSFVAKPTAVSNDGSAWSSNLNYLGLINGNNTTAGTIYHGVINGTVYTVGTSSGNNVSGHSGSMTGVSDAGAVGTAFKSWKGHMVVAADMTASYMTSHCGGGECQSMETVTGKNYVIVSAPGTGASETDTTGHMKKNGVDATGETVKITKKTEVKELTVKENETIEKNLTVKGNETIEKDLTVKGSETVEKDLHVKGNETVEGKIHGKSDAEFDKNVTIHGSESIEKNLTVNGDTHIKGNTEIDGNTEIHGKATIDGDSKIKGDTEIDGNTTLHKNLEVDGDTKVHGNESIDKDLKVSGETVMKGDVKMESDLKVEGSTQLGDDKKNDTLDVYAKTNLHGDTSVGDDAKDSFTVNATSTFKADATFEKDVYIKGNQEIDGNSDIHGYQNIDKDLHVRGDSRTDGNAQVDGDFSVKGNSSLGDSKYKDTVDINAKANLHGDTTIGDSDYDKPIVNATSEFTANATFGKDVFIKGSTEIDKNLAVHGNTVLDGTFFAKGAAAFGDNVDIAKNLNVGGNAHVAGDEVVDGDIYGRSFNVGNEKYIDKDGINANNHPIRNVADGAIGPDSLDAVNGRQLWHTREALQNNISQVGAGSAALANLHPLEFEHNDKVSVSAAVGNYKDQTAFAAGVYVRPDTKSLISLSGTLGYNENMLGVGFSKKFGKHTDFENMTEDQLKDALSKLSEDAKDIREQNKALKADNKELSEKLAQNSKDDAALKASTDKQIEKLTSDNAGLKAKLSDMSKDYEGRMSIMSKAYDALQSKVDSLMEKLKNLTSAK